MADVMLSLDLTLFIALQQYFPNTSWQITSCFQFSNYSLLFRH